MTVVTFSEVSVNAPFWVDGEEYIKIDPNVPRLNTFVNAELVSDRTKQFWFENNDLVEVNVPVRRRE